LSGFYSTQRAREGHQGIARRSEEDDDDGDRRRLSPRGRRCQNLIFSEYRMPARRNTSEFYDAKDKKPAGKREGTVKLGALESSRRTGGIRLGFVILGAVIGGAVALSRMGKIKHHDHFATSLLTESRRGRTGEALCQAPR